MPENEDLFESVAAADEIADTLTLSSRDFARSLRRGMRDAVVEGRGLESTLRRAAMSLSRSALTAGMRPLTGMVGSAANSIVGGLSQTLMGAFRTPSTQVVPFAEGGVIGTPTTFHMGDGRVGLMGEAGREAVLPLARGTDGRLGVAVEGGGASQPSITINVSTPDAESFRRSEAQVTAMLARAVGRGRRGL
ncbi:MAG: phage tail tape measure protein [Pseudomonadota bacterium]